MTVELRGPTRVLGQLLLQAGSIDSELLATALREQRTSRRRLGEILVQRGVDPEAIAQALAQQLRLQHSPAPLQPTREALALLDRETATRLRVVPLAVHDRSLCVAMADPLDMNALDQLQFKTGRRIEAAVATPQAVTAALQAYDADTVASLVLRLPTVERASGESTDDLLRASEAPPIIALVDHILTSAAQARASDVHIEPAPDRLRVRARVDGVLRDILELPAHVAPALVSRIKIMASLDISVKRRPQDGRCTLQVSGREHVARVSTLPSHAGEKVVLRLLAAAHSGPSLLELGFDAETLRAFRALLRKSHGVVLVTGPTGAGKTTTLYGALSELDQKARNIITLEDPIEYRLPGLTQVQVHRRAGMTFARALRAVLRQDPDTIMVGELRDRDTVEVALAAALTGHLVLSTIHTNDAPATAARLIEMGAAPYLIAGALVGVLAQRLARKLCPHCRRPRLLSARESESIGVISEPVHVYEAAGCAHCDQTGYRGRVGIFELMRIDARLRQLILRRTPVEALRDAARAAGMSPLGQDAWRKVLSGLTTIEEVTPLLSLLADEAPSCAKCGAALSESFAVCPGCGRVLRRICRCGGHLEAHWQWCPACGSAALASADTGQTVPAAD